MFGVAPRMNLPHDNPILDELSGNAALLTQVEEIRKLFLEDANPEAWETTWLEDEREKVRDEARERRQVMADRISGRSRQGLRLPGPFKAGDLVMLRDLNVAKDKGMKFAYRWTGPFVVHKRTESGVSYVLKHIHDTEDRMLYGHHHRDDLKLWSARPSHLSPPEHIRLKVELPRGMRQYRRRMVAALKGKV
ncbi:hypothetical protein EDC01DRAFT_627817 [Geopyxis carbonaria]|nr:hypothetical protein EDC01DRAFT_627817 [Geopyxis carbonaria]